MLLNVLTSEFTKLRTTKSFWGNTLFYVLLTVGFTVLTAALFSSMAADAPGLLLEPMGVAQGINMGGSLVLAVMSVLVVTNEYSQKYISVTFQACPNRITVALAKFLMMAIVATGFSILAFFICIPLAHVIAGKDIAPDITLTNAAIQEYLWRSPVYAILFILLAQGLAWIVRSAVVAIVVILGWYLAVEPMILPMAMKFGDKILPYAPFKNLSAFYYNQSIEEVPWGAMGSLGYFACWALALFIAGMVMLVRRDA